MSWWRRRFWDNEDEPTILIDGNDTYIAGRSLIVSDGDLYVTQSSDRRIEVTEGEWEDE